MLSTPQPDFSVKWSALGPIEINLANFGWYSHSILCDFYHLIRIERNGNFSQS